MERQRFPAVAEQSLSLSGSSWRYEAALALLGFLLHI